MTLVFIPKGIGFLKEGDAMLRKLRKKTGQSTLEYIILVAVLIALFAVFLPGIFKTEVQEAMEYGTNGMLDMANRLSVSRPAG
jgi:competence protein ComGC